MTPANVVYCTGDILLTDCHAVIIPVNCRTGVMGKGLALQAKQKWPRLAAYECDPLTGPGGVQLVDIHHRRPWAAVLFATKDHYRNPSRLEWVAQGCESLPYVLAAVGIGSVAIPALGCGEGGLSWDDVRPLIEECAAKMPGVRVDVYPPQRDRR